MARKSGGGGRTVCWRGRHIGRLDRRGLEIMVGEVEGEKIVVDAIMMTCVTDDQR